MNVKVYDFRDADLRRCEVIPAVSKIERWILTDEGNKEELVFHSNGNKIQFKLGGGVAFVLFADDENPDMWQLRKKDCGNPLVVKIGNIEIKDHGKLKITSPNGYSEEATVRYMDQHHFEMSNASGQFDAVGSHVWANTEYEIFCRNYGITLEAV
jgi:hypothetical protein